MSILFTRFDAGVYCGLTEKQAFGGHCKMIFIGDGDKTASLIEFHLSMLKGMSLSGFMKISIT